MHTYTPTYTDYIYFKTVNADDITYRQIQSDLMDWRNKGYIHPDTKCNKKRIILQPKWEDLQQLVITVYNTLDIQDDITPVEYEVIECENGAVINPVSEVIISQESAPVEDVITPVETPEVVLEQALREVNATGNYGNFIPLTPVRKRAGLTREVFNNTLWKLQRDGIVDEVSTVSEGQRMSNEDWDAVIPGITDSSNFFFVMLAA